MDFSETIVGYDIKVGRCSQLHEYMKLYEYQRSRSFIYHWSKSLRFNNFKLFFSITAYFNVSSALRSSGWTWGCYLLFINIPSVICLAWILFKLSQDQDFPDRGTEAKPIAPSGFNR